MKTVKHIKFVLLFLLGLNLGCPGGFMGDYNKNPVYISDSFTALNGSWVLDSVRCNDELSTYWQNLKQSMGIQLSWQIQNEQTTSSKTDNSGCTITTNQTLQPQGNFKFTATITQQNCSSQCDQMACSRTGKSSSLNVSAVSNTLTSTDNSDADICQAGGQSGPLVSYFKRVGP